MESDERAPLLEPHVNQNHHMVRSDEDAESSHLTKDEHNLYDASVGERLAYNDYTTIDWLHDLVKDSYRFRFIGERKGIRFQLIKYFDQASGWIAAALIGSLTACVAFLVDVAEATVSDWKLGYCSPNPLKTREACCAANRTPLTHDQGARLDCVHWKPWSSSYASLFLIYLAFALAYGTISGSVTLLTKRSLPATTTAPDYGDGDQSSKQQQQQQQPSPVAGKSMYMAAGSGIPEIKTILSGFVIPGFLDFPILAVKAMGAVFAVATGMCLGKEGPFVHIATSVGYLVAKRFHKYRDNGRKMREMLSAACAAGLSVAFGAPIGGVLFAYEEISTYFPRKVLWRAFLCSLCAAIVLRALNPNGTGKLVLFETNYGTSYSPVHYLAFVFLGIVGGVFGGLFCKLNYVWSKWFRSFGIIKNHPVLEVFLVVGVTVLLQYPNPLTREPGDAIIKNLLVDCRDDDSESRHTWVCQQESFENNRSAYYGFLVHGTLTKLVLTIVTFGIKVPSGIIIPSLDAGAFFGRLTGQVIPGISPGIFAMVGAASFLAGVSRMTVSLVVVMFELTGELEYTVPHMLAILTSKWVADSLGGKESVYDLAQNVLGHPFLDMDHSMHLVQNLPQHAIVAHLLPPKQTMDEITVHVPAHSKTVSKALLAKKLLQLKARGLMDAGLVLVQQPTGILRGYLGQAELEFGLGSLSGLQNENNMEQVRLLGSAAAAADAAAVAVAVAPSGEGEEEEEEEEEQENIIDLSHFVDRTPLTLSAVAPMEYAVEMFGKLGLRYLMITEEGTGKLVGVVIKKRLVAYLDAMKKNAMN